ncbi:ABC transporter permease [Lacticaseibacillus zeae]|uniref:Na ABC transporter permease n=2 Tax=Lacticaseibacillus zeae TaxID=57037 RepID=A0A0R1EUR1_LACZE|nr:MULTISPECIES: ABC transporter permease [Lacticaseibacillus]OFS00133.1 ABC transporter permease [Lactobacillus sp. HMSC068F07]KRK12959.1 Na ABC transporter permease [Lacticaseibacillus zeae DSM 20178 = KCTC 3804]MDE3314849.1 ABC transporter permease [Lacticaseibacillus zeae]QVI32889.1 ABC transporter permease [Lacticaseibacillus zeae]WLV84455.1 ABC transporter permease [Lacticaseibacillus sp. NCIMB 15475]
MHKFWVVMSQVYKKNAKSGSWIFLVLSPLLFLAIGFGIAFYIAKTQAPAQVAVVSDVSAVSQALSKQNNDDLHFKVYSSSKKADAALNDEKVDGILTVNAKDQFRSRYVSRDNGQEVDKTTLVTALSGLKLSSTAASMHLTAAQVSALTQPPMVSTKTVAIENGKQVTKSNSTQLMNHGVAVVAMILILMVTMVYGSILAQEIATEKGSRIMEILLSSVSATTQFFGKLAGIFALLLTQLAIYVVAGVISWQFVKNQSFVSGVLKQFDFSILVSGTTAMIVVFFIIGTLTYSVLAALTGSLVSNQEQVQQAAMPISMLGLIGYFITIAAQSSDSALAQITSYVPFLNVFVMPTQMSLGRASMGEAWISVAISLVFLVLFTMFTVKVYRNNVLVYSGSGLWQSMKTSFSIWKSERSVAKK